MKIICKDNFDRETRSESVVAENVPEYYIELLVEALNAKHSGEHSENWFKAEPDDYQPYEFEP